MTEAKMSMLTDRGVVRVAGPEAAKFLQGLVTNDMAALERQPAIHAGLLTPQGKILFDFFIVAGSDGFMLEAARGQIGALVRRLSLYKLRSNVSIEDVSAHYTVAAAWDGGERDEPPGGFFRDPRLAALGFRAHLPMASDWALGESGAPSTPDDYHAHRIALGVPEGGKDYAFGDAFPHEALFDRLDGASFTKGCFIGQEVVSRMEHRGTARKRVVRVTGEKPLPPMGTDIRAGEALIGTMGSSAGTRGLALIRLDRAAEAVSRGDAIMAGETALAVEVDALAGATPRG